MNCRTAANPCLYSNKCLVPRVVELGDQQGKMHQPFPRGAIGRTETQLHSFNLGLRASTQTQSPSQSVEHKCLGGRDIRLLFRRRGAHQRGSTLDSRPEGTCSHAKQQGSLARCLSDICGSTACHWSHPSGPAYGAYPMQAGPEAG